MSRLTSMIWIVPFFVFAQAGVARGDAQQELDFALRLQARGLVDMAQQVLADLEKSPDPAEARAGRFGKAILRKQSATLARQRFIRELEEGRTPKVTRAEVLAAFEEAKPKIEEYVTSRPDELDPRFLLAEVLQEYGEFLTGADYPDERVEEKKQLVSDNAQQAEKLFESAIEHYAKVAEQARERMPKEAEADDPMYVRWTDARYQKARARMRLALMYPGGAKFQFNADTAADELDTFMGEHFEDIYGARAMLDLGILNFEKAMRQKAEADAASTALDYFAGVYTSVEELPEYPITSEVIGKAFYWYGRTCTALARGEGALPKKQPQYLENAIKAGPQLRAKLKTGAKNPWALRALLEVADAYATMGRFDEAVSIAGEALSGARVEGHRNVTNVATMKLTGWVASVEGAGALDASLLFQIGDSLDNQGQTSNAVIFFEKAISASETDEDKERWAYPSRVRIAKAYRRDNRLFAAARVAGLVVDEYVKSGQEEEDPFGQIASDACNVARLCWKQISEWTTRPADTREYDRIKEVFRQRFPGHPENADQAFSRMKEEWNNKNFAEAAKLALAISPTSPNYWLAQRMVPACYRNLASDAKDAEVAKEQHDRTLEAAGNLMTLAAGKDDPGAQKAYEYGMLFKAMALASLERHADALAAIDNYLSKYPDNFPKRGLEYKIKVDAHLALGQLDEAEQTLAPFGTRFPSSSYNRRALYDVYTALRNKYKEMGPGADRAALANRAANLFEQWVKTVRQPDPNLLYFLGDVMQDAQRYEEAADAFSNAAEMLPPDDPKRAGFTQFAAKAQYRYVKQQGDSLPRDKAVETLKRTRELFTDVLIPPETPERTEQAKIVQILGKPEWPKADVFEKIKRNADALVTAAEVYMDSSPQGVDGRQVAIKLLAHLHGFTQAMREEGKEKVNELVPFWWDGAHLRLKAYLAIAKDGGPAGKQAAEQGFGLATKWLFQYPTCDSEERANEFKALEAQLRVLAKR